MTAIAAFVTAHGFGHATRTCAVLEAVGRRLTGLRFELFTDAPRWLFSASLGVPFRIHAVQGDVGLVQRSAFDFDLPATVEALDRLLPLDEQRVAACAAVLERSGCRVVVADIAPLGIAAGRRASVPTVLVENFTWDWIYRGLQRPPRRLLDHATSLETIYRDADLRLRAEPACGDDAGRRVAPVWRPHRTSREQVRRRLGIGPDRKMVLVSVGGFGGVPDRLSGPNDRSPMTLVLPGTVAAREAGDGIIRMPARSDLSHPDLVAAADVVIGKLGYSTVAEVVGAGTPMAYVPRDGFPESPVLEAFLTRSVPTERLERTRFEAGEWLESVARLCRRQRSPPPEENGADAIADAIVSLLDR